jgi:flagellar hook-length control protein FliK
VRLDPEHLGPLTLTVSVRAGKVRLAVSGSPEALSALDASMNGLRDQLGSAGLGLDGVSLQPTSATGSGSSATDGRPGQSGAAFAATADSAGDGGRRAPDERGRTTGSGPDDRGSRTTAGSSGVSADPDPQVTVRTGSGPAGRVDVRV